MNKLKYILLLLIFIFSFNKADAQITYETQKPEGLSCCVTRVVTNSLGCNLIAKKIATSTIKKILKKETSGDYKVKIDSFSAMDLKRGKFKSLKIDGKNISSDGIYLSNFQLATINKYNYIDYTKKPMVFHTDLPMSFETVITEEDLNNTLSDMKYFQQLISLCSNTIPMVNIDNISFKIKHNKLYLIVTAKVPLIIAEKTIRITLSGKLNVENGRIVLENIQSENMRSFNFNKFVDKLNDLNPFDMPISIVDGADSAISVNNVKILDNKIYIDGIIVIKRSCDG